MELQRKTVIGIVIAIVSIGVVVVLLWLSWWFNLWPERPYTAVDFQIETLLSAVDFDQDGVDDYADLVVGARKDAEKHPRYDGSYQPGGFPPDEIGVCTDVIWRAFREAGYDLRAMVDRDIAKFPEDYPWVTQRDQDIDFRRVVNLEKFFQKYGESLTLDTNDISAWQPGDLIIAENGTHIGLVSDKRNREGKSYIIHNAGQPKREEDYLKRARIDGHYRFNAAKIDPQVLVKWSAQ